MNLLDYRFDKYSSTGNDGIIEFIFNTLNIKNGFFVEFGAWDGIKGSNCRKLWEEGWKGIFIEGSKDKYIKLIKNYKPEDLYWPWDKKEYDFESIVCINKYIDFEKNKFDNVVEKYVPQGGIDFCSVDIDGLDLEVFESFEKYHPLVVCIEGGQMLEPEHPSVPSSVAKNNIQQSLSTIQDICEKKGYKILCSYQDTFLIKQEYYDLFNVTGNLTEMYYDGLLAHHRRIPWIQLKLSEVGVTNNIINTILEKTNYSNYGFGKRKVWASEEQELILSTIQQEKQNFLNS